MLLSYTLLHNVYNTYIKGLNWKVYQLKLGIKFKVLDMFGQQHHVNAVLETLHRAVLLHCSCANCTCCVFTLGASLLVQSEFCTTQGLQHWQCVGCFLNMFMISDK